jgi:hypothetical protein
VIIYDVPVNAPSQIIYQDVTDLGIAGVIDIVDKQGPTGPTGPTGPVGTPTQSTYTPVWQGTGLTVVGTPTAGLYIRTGNLVHFSITVTCNNVTNFGTGQYSITLPFLPNSSTRATIHGLIDNGVNEYAIKGVVDLGSAFMPLWYVGTANLHTAMTGAAPITLSTFSTIYLSGSYIADPA